MPDVDGYYTVDEVAAMFKITPGTVRDWLRANKLHGIHLNRRWLVTPDAIRDFVKRGRK